MQDNVLFIFSIFSWGACRRGPSPAAASYPKPGYALALGFGLIFLVLLAGNSPAWAGKAASPLLVRLAPSGWIHARAATDSPVGIESLSPAIGSLARSSGARVRAVSAATPPEWQVWEFASAARRDEALRRLRSMPGIAHVEVAATRRLAAVIPNDVNFGNQWGLRNIGQTVGGRAGTPGADIGATQYWQNNTGSAGIIVAVIDTGITLTHPDLQGNLWVNSGEIPGNGIDDDGNGFVDDVHGWATFNNTNAIEDLNGHGTAVSSIIGADTNNALGMAGVAWNVSLMTLNAFGDSGETTDDKLVAAIDYAVANGAHLINASWGGGEYTEVLRQAVERAWSAGVVICAAAGNEHQRMDLHPFYPAAFRYPNVISIGALDNQDVMPFFSVRGGSGVDVLAPGVSVQVALRNGSYGYSSGTSYAAPHVAGALALLYQQQPGIDPAVAARRILGATVPIKSAREQCRSQGRLWLPALLNADSIAPAAINDLEAMQIVSNGARVSWTAPGDNGYTGSALFYDVRVSSSPLTMGNYYQATLPAWIPTPREAGARQSMVLTGLEPSTDYYVAARAVDRSGNIGPLGTVLQFRTRDCVTILRQSWESGLGDWQATAPWHLDAGRVSDGDGLYACSTAAATPAGMGTYDLVSPPFSLVGFENPVLRYQQLYNFDSDYSGDPVAPKVYGRIEVSTDGGAAWTRLAVVHSIREPYHLQTLSLGSAAGAASVRLRWQLVVNTTTAQHTAWYVDAIRVEEPSAWLPEPATVLVEPFGEQGQFPNDLAGYTETVTSGAWTTSAQRARIAYTLSPYARELDLAYRAGASALYTPDFPVTGTYQVLVSWPRTANAANVIYRVNHATGSIAFSQNQNGPVNGEEWISLGLFYFEKGRATATGSVMLDAGEVTDRATSSLPGRIAADGIRFDFINEGLPAKASSLWMIRGLE